MSKEKIIEKIRSVLDLNLYEAKVYLAIIAYGPLEKKQVYKKAEIPQARVYDTITSLINKGLINCFIKDKKEFCYSLNPKYSIKAYFTQLKWDHEKEIERERMKFENKINLIKNNFSKKIREKQKISRELIKYLTKIYKETIPSDNELFQVIKGEANLVNYIAEQVKYSKKVIKNVSLPPYLPEALIWENISNKLKEGLKYFHLAYSGLILEWGLWRINVDQKTGVVFKFLPKKDINQKFYIFDDNSCFIRLKDPITNDFSDQGVFIREKTLLSDYIKKFDKLWKKASTFEELKNKILTKKREVYKRLNENEQKVLSKILERGKYAVMYDLNIDNVKNILKSLEKKKLIVPFQKATLGYIANIKFFLGEKHSF